MACGAWCSCRGTLEFNKCQDLKNPWNDSKPVKISRDGQVSGEREALSHSVLFSSAPFLDPAQEVEPSVGEKLCRLWQNVEPSADDPAAPPHAHGHTHSYSSSRHPAAASSSSGSGGHSSHTSHPPPIPSYPRHHLPPAYAYSPYHPPGYPPMGHMGRMPLLPPYGPPPRLGHPPFPGRPWWGPGLRGRPLNRKFGPPWNDSREYWSKPSNVSPRPPSPPRATPTTASSNDDSDKSDKNGDKEA